MAVQNGKWSSGLFSCFEDSDICCMTFWCPCVTVGRIIEIVSEGRTESTTGCCLFFVIAAFTGCGCMYTCTYRQRLREKYGLPAAPCGDCLLHNCCGQCAYCQEARELKSRGMDPALGWAAAHAQFQMGGAPPQQGMYK